MLAAESGDTTTIIVLLDHGAELTRDWGKWTPLMFAARNGHLDASKLLVERGVDVNKGSSALYSAVFGRHEELALYLIEQGAKPDFKEGDQGWRPLMVAAEKNLFAVAKSLIEHGAKVNAATKAGWTPLLYAARHGSLDIARLLIENDADVKTQTKEDKLSALMLAATGGHAEIADLLIEHGADVKRKSKNKTTVLMYAANGGDQELVEKLIDIGLKPNDRNREMTRPIHFAFGNDHDDIGRRLLERGADMQTLQHTEFSCYATGRCFLVVARDCLEVGDTATAVEHLGVAVDYFGRAEKKYRKSADRAEGGGSPLLYNLLRLAASTVDLHQVTKKKRMTNYRSLFPDVEAAAPDQSRADRLRETADKCQGLCDDSRKMLDDLGHPLPPEKSD
jgi:ankyrin repeat protein